MLPLTGPSKEKLGLKLVPQEANNSARDQKQSILNRRSQLMQFLTSDSVPLPAAGSASAGTAVAGGSGDKRDGAADGAASKREVAVGQPETGKKY